MDLTKPIAESFDRTFLRSMGADVDDPLLLAEYWPYRIVHARRGGRGPMPDGILLQLATNQYLRSVVKEVTPEATKDAPSGAAPIKVKRETAKAS